MSKTWDKVKFDEDHRGGQELIQMSCATTDYNYFFYVNEDGEKHLMFSCSDACLEALGRLTKYLGSIYEPSEQEIIECKKLKQ